MLERDKDLAQSITFESVKKSHIDIIFQWLAEPHMQEFWDNSQEHKDDIIHFVEGRKTASNYFNGIFSYWIGKYNEDPFCLILTAKENNSTDLPELWMKHLSTTGNTYSLDFGIGNPKYIGKKLAGPTLALFTQFIQKEIDLNADTFFIDPANDNPRAKHVYEQAGFQLVGTFTATQGFFQDDESLLMVLKRP
ncbi:MAG: GNAT family N-acetyltransferase [Legionella sp.]|nr:MAG: GNAT family N-acetyltransferase [Legionella sp.]